MYEVIGPPRQTSRSSECRLCFSGDPGCAYSEPLTFRPSFLQPLPCYPTEATPLGAQLRSAFLPLNVNGGFQGPKTAGGAQRWKKKAASFSPSKVHDTLFRGRSGLASQLSDTPINIVRMNRVQSQARRSPRESRGVTCRANRRARVH